MTFRLSIALALIDQHRCPCFACKGQLATCEWPTWRRCQDCRCCWKADDLPAGRRACRTRDDGRRCPAQTQVAPEPAATARRSL